MHDQLINIAPGSNVAVEVPSVAPHDVPIGKADRSDPRHPTRRPTVVDAELIRSELGERQFFGGEDMVLRVERLGVEAGTAVDGDAESAWGEDLGGITMSGFAAGFAVTTA